MSLRFKQDECVSGTLEMGSSGLYQSAQLPLRYQISIQGIAWKTEH